MSEEPGPTRRKYRKRITDVNAPRRPTTAFNFFIKMNSAEYVEKHKNTQLNDIIKIISADWHKLTDEQKKPYHEAAAVAREEYEKLLAEYHTSSEYQQFLQLKRDVQSGLVDPETVKGATKRKSNSTSNVHHHPINDIKSKMPKKKFNVDFEVFSDKFKEFNRHREDELRRLRKIVYKLEEEIEDSEEAIEKLQKEKLKLATEHKEHIYIQNRCNDTASKWRKAFLSNMSERQLEQYGLKKDSTVSQIIKALTEAQKNSTLTASLKKYITGVKFN